MKLLVDANLSWRLVKLIQLSFPDAIHVIQTELPIPAKDIEIWNWAKKNNYSIVTNDEDFFYLLSAKGFPPKIIMIRTGNQTTRFIADVLNCDKEQIETIIRSKEYGVLEIY
ncbi:MAG: DUF5615 family PIN-like protein [Chitinophagales bacterium]|nr:DUF5615 family PIN-like protein [Chitinophagales bacterium]